MEITVYFDGACEWYNGKRNPGGIATYGWVIYLGNKQLAYGLGEAGRGDNNATNNIAEYHALIKALEAIQDLDLHDNKIHIKGDSQLIVKQVTGEWKCNKAHLRTLRDKAKNLLHENTLTWVPREQNEEADSLSKKAYQISKNGKDGPWYERYKKT